MDQEFTTEAKCPVCSRWPEKEKDWRRSLINRIPLGKAICIRCAVAFWSGFCSVSEEETGEFERQRSVPPPTH
jgi:hypothetical protein